MHPSIHARITPHKTAVIMGESGEAMTYGELEAGSNRVAHLLRSLSLFPHDHVAVLMENVIEYFPIVWGMQRCGLYFTCISSRLAVEEILYIVNDCGVKALIVDRSLEVVGEQLQSRIPDLRIFSTGGGAGRIGSLGAALSSMPTTPIPDEGSGIEMLYSSGTTGRPKGVKPVLLNGPLDQSNGVTDLARKFWGMSERSIYLSPAPLYHAAPLRFGMATHKLGGTVVVMERFDALKAIELIGRYRVSHAQWVPTHFVRMLKLPAGERLRYDHSSLEVVIHAAAPCPVEVKQAMLDWWGPIVYEYYSATEMNGLTHITPEEWLKRPGSVGKAVWGKIKICDDNGDEIPARTEGLIHFADGYEFEYHNDPVKTAAARNKNGWTTLGDVGWVDEESYLYLTDRKSFMIISGGVNIYPQEIEDVLLGHPAVLDAAVVGAPDEDMGEKVVAVIQPIHWEASGPALAAEISDWLSARLSRFKQPRLIEFDQALPRHPTGKLYKREIRDRYWRKG
jgi:long-chain acyl-CoA synthetase